MHDDRSKSSGHIVDSRCMPYGFKSYVWKKVYQDDMS